MRSCLVVSSHNAIYTMIYIFHVQVCQLGVFFLKSDPAHHGEPKRSVACVVRCFFAVLILSRVNVKNFLDRLERADKLSYATVPFQGWLVYEESQMDQSGQYMKVSSSNFTYTQSHSHLNNIRAPLLLLPSADAQEEPNNDLDFSCSLISVRERTIFRDIHCS